MSDLFKEIEKELESSYIEDTKEDSEPQTQEIVDISTKKKSKKPLSEIAKKARTANLAKGRELRKKRIQERKRLEQMYTQYDQDSEDDEEDDEMFAPKLPMKQQRGGSKKIQKLELELQAMRNIVSKLSKKKEKQIRQPVVINNQVPMPQQPTQNDDITNLLKTKILKF
jgi:hypothetical protein